jgi:hypothetical protein
MRNDVPDVDLFEPSAANLALLVASWCWMGTWRFLSQSCGWESVISRGFLQQFAGLHHFNESNHSSNSRAISLAKLTDFDWLRSANQTPASWKSDNLIGAHSAI